MFQEIAMTDRTAFATGAFIYMAAFVIGGLLLLIKKPYPRALMFALLACGFLIQTLGLNLRGAEI